MRIQSREIGPPDNWATLGAGAANLETEVVVVLDAWPWVAPGV